MTEGQTRKINYINSVKYRRFFFSYSNILSNYTIPARRHSFCLFGCFNLFVCFFVFVLFCVYIYLYFVFVIFEIIYIMIKLRLFSIPFSHYSPILFQFLLHTCSVCKIYIYHIMKAFCLICYRPIFTDVFQGVVISKVVLAFPSWKYKFL